MKESNILKQIEIEAGKRGYIALRLNSGHFYNGTPKTVSSGLVLTNLRHIAGLPEGTADLMILCDGGKTLFVETKTKTGCQREAQKRFETAIKKLGHTYILARSVGDVFND